MSALRSRRSAIAAGVALVSLATPAAADPPALPAPEPPPYAARPPVYTGTVDASRTSSDRASAHPFTIGVEALFGPGGIPTDAPDVVAAPTLSLGYTVVPHVTVGMGGIGAGFRTAPDGRTSGVSIGPFVEAYSFVGGTTQWYGQAGIPLELRFGGSGGGNAVTFAPYVGVGTRFWIAPTLSLGIGTRLQIAGASYFQAGNAVLAQGAVVWTFGPELAFHF